MAAPEPAMPTGAGGAPQWRVCVLLGEHHCPGGDWWPVAQAAVQGGCDCIQLREKALLDVSELIRRGRRLVDLCRPRGVSVVVNDRPDVAVACGADGVHLGQQDIPCNEARRIVGHQVWIGVSTSCIEQARCAVQEGADYCGVGPMYPSRTKHKPVLAGPAYLRQFVERFPDVPHLAIGGITPARMAELVAAGARGVAVAEAVCAAADPAAVVRDLSRFFDPMGPTATAPPPPAKPTPG